jgi:hypothetical protein
MLTRILGFVAVSSFVALAACSSEDEPPAAKYPAVDSFCDAKAKEECQVAVNCAANEKTCANTRKTKCLEFAAAAQTGTRAYRTKQGETCVDKTKETYAKKSAITPDDIKKLDEVCQKAFQGTVKSGQACTINYDCEGDLICDKNECAKKVEKKEGEGCANAGEVCATGSRCTQATAGASFKCNPLKKKGELCNAANDPCIEGLRCDNTCIDAFGSGEPCDPAGKDCGTAAPYCDPAIGNKCGPGFIAAPGAAACGECKPGANPGLCGFGA